MNELKNNRRGQVILEFTFCMIIVVILTIAMMMIFRWASLDLAGRRVAHDQTLLSPIHDDWVGAGDGPLRQLNDEFYQPMELDLIE